MQHLAPTLFQRPDRIKEPLYVVTSVFNPVRFRSRWKLYEDFVKMVEASGAILYTVEVAYGDRQFAVTEPDNLRHLQLVTRDELWLKENALNLLIERLPSDWKYVAWVDADVHFLRPDWANEIVHALQHYDVVQPWSEAYDLNAQHEIVTTHKSFMWCYYNDPGVSLDAYSYGQGKGQCYYWHPGYSAAWRRSALDAVGGLIDWTILGGGDLYMMRGLTGITKSLPRSLGANGQRLLRIWNERAEKHIKRNVGYIDGAIAHYYHGPKAARAYNDRGQILINARFDPERDLKRDWQGLYQLETGNNALRDGIRRYFRNRNEDAV